MTVLHAIGWDHPRCMRPMRACAERWGRLHPDVEVRFDARSLLAFGDQPLEQLCERYDLLVIDHPFCGTAAATGCLLPLDELLPADQLGALAADAIGPSHDSYRYAGHQWGLATDAACQVAAAREELLDGPPPVDWDGVLALARRAPGAVGLPLAPAHAISSFLSLCANSGSPPAEQGALADRQVAEDAAALLVELAARGPRAALDWEPPEALAELVGGATLSYVPLTYGYCGYAVRFLDVPSSGRGPVGSVLGGAGLAVSARSAAPLEAAAFAAWASGATAQREIVAVEGGQPGSRSAWDDPHLDRLAHGLYRGTRATMEHAWTRPREPWWPGFQLAAGRALNDGLRAGATPARLVDELEGIYAGRHT